MFYIFLVIDLTIFLHSFCKKSYNKNNLSCSNHCMSSIKKGKDEKHGKIHTHIASLSGSQRDSEVKEIVKSIRSEVKEM